MAEILQQRINSLSNTRDQDELKAMLGALVDGIRAITVKLDAEAAGGVTGFDTNYTAGFDAIVTKV